MRASLTAFAQSIQIPGAPVGGDDSELFAPVGSGMASHHILMCEAIQKCMETDYGRLMLFFPPGSAKSTYASAIAPAWFMGNNPGYPLILASYGTDLAKKHGRKARSVCKQAIYADAFGGSTVSRASSAAELWATTNGSEYMAGGLLSGLTGNRARGLIIDDPIKGAEAADSPAIRSQVKDAIDFDAMSRLSPRAFVILVQTRWHPLDPAGQLLPEDYHGQSGPVVCADGMTWNVLNVPAEAEHADDPLGRAPGEMLWPEYFDKQHWDQYRSKPRMWAALYQQRPSLAGGGSFKREWAEFYEPGEEPAREDMNVYGASDWGAPAEDGTDTDFTEHGVVGLDSALSATGEHLPNLWLLDWSYGVVTTDKGAESFFSLVKQWRPLRWWNEKGPIWNAIRPAIADRMKRAPRRVFLDALPSSGNKVARAETFFALCESGRVRFPNTVWGRRLVDQLCAFPVVAHDDAVDVASLIGRALEGMAWKYVSPEAPDADLKPFSVAWLMYGEKKKPTGNRTR